MQMKMCATITLLWATALLGACGVAPVATVDPEATSDLPQVTPTPTGVPEPTTTPLPSPTATEMAVSTPTGPPAQEPNGEPMLKMVLITAKSSQEVEQLRKMHLDVVRVRSVDPDEPLTLEGKGALAGEFIVEAVISSDMLPKLKSMGFEITEVP